jgi:periplasmic protein CpxP/Spy
MKKKLMLMLGGIVISAAIMAQEPPPENAPEKKSPQERAENMSNRLAKELALSADQKEKVKAVILKREMAREKNMEAMKDERDKVDAEFKAIMNPEQFKKFQEKKEEMMKKRRESKTPPPRGEGPPPPKDK